MSSKLRQRHPKSEELTVNLMRGFLVATRKAMADGEGNKRRRWRSKAARELQRNSSVGEARTTLNMRL